MPFKFFMSLCLLFSLQLNAENKMYEDKIGLVNKLDKFLPAKFLCIISVEKKEGFELFCDGVKFAHNTSIPGVDKAHEARMTVAMFYLTDLVKNRFNLISCESGYRRCLFKRG